MDWAWHKPMPSCPFCGSPFGPTGGLIFGCTDSSCPEHPSIHDPVGCAEWVDEFWDEVQRTAPEVRRQKREELRKLQNIVGQYYQG